MTPLQAQPIQWLEDKHKKLDQIKGFWAQDEWDISKCPLATEDMVSLSKVGKFRFNRIPKSIRLEIKYACWQKFSKQQWSITNPRNAAGVNFIVKWLAAVPPFLLSFKRV